MMQNYQTWEKFDVEAELSKLEEQEKQEEVRQKAAAVEQKKDVLLGEVVESVQEQAETLSAHAAVAALRAKRNRRNLARATVPSQSLETGSAVAIQREVNVVQEFSLKMQEMRARKADGDRKRKEGLYDDAISQYISCLQAAEGVDCLITQLQSHSDSEPSVHFEAESKACHACHKQEHNDCGNGQPDEKEMQEGVGCNSHSHSHGREKSKHQGPTLPKKDDLKGILRLVRSSTHSSLGLCYFHIGALADAADALRMSLLEEDKDGDVWIKRGEVFMALGVPLLAELHFSQVQTKEGEEERKLAEDQILLGLTEAFLEEKETRALDAASNSKLALLELVQASRKAGDVLLREQFYHSAERKYEAAIRAFNRLVSRTSQHHPKLSEEEVKARILKSAAIRETLRAVMLSQSVCLTKLNKQPKKVIELCSEALTLALDPDQETEGLFRRCKGWQMQYRYSQAISDAEAALGRCKTSPRRSVIAKELDRLHFLYQQMPIGDGASKAN